MFPVDVLMGSGGAEPKGVSNARYTGLVLR